MILPPTGIDSNLSGGVACHVWPLLFIYCILIHSKALHVLFFLICHLSNFKLARYDLFDCLPLRPFLSSTCTVIYDGSPEHDRATIKFITIPDKRNALGGLLVFRVPGFLCEIKFWESSRDTITHWLFQAPENNPFKILCTNHFLLQQPCLTMLPWWSLWPIVGVHKNIGHIGTVRFVFSHQSPTRLKSQLVVA